MSDFDLKGKRIADTYKGLLKLAVSGNGAVSSSLTQVEGGDGTNTALFVATDSVKVGGTFAVSSSVSVGGSLKVTGDVCASSYYGSGRHLTSIVATGDTSVSTLVVANTAEIGGALSVGGAVTLAGAVNLLSTATVSGAAGFLGSVRVSGATSLGGTLDVAGTATFTNVDVDDINLNGKVFTVSGDTGDTFKITAGANGATTLETVDTAGADGHLTLDVDGQIKLDSGASQGDTRFLMNGTHYGTIRNISDHLYFKAIISDKDIYLQGNDGGSTVTALRLDMSDAGRAYFNDGATFNNDIAVEDITLSGKVLTITGSPDDTFKITAGTDGATTLATVDTAGNAANFFIDADGYIRLDSGSTYGTVQLAHDGTIYGDFHKSGDNIKFRSGISDGDLILSGYDGGVGINALSLDMSEAGKATFNDGATFNGDVTLTGAANNVVWDKSDNALEFSDDAKAVFGTGSDLTILHNGNNSTIQHSGTGSLLFYLGFELAIQATPNSSVKLFHDGVQKFTTTATGATITGGIVADSATVDDISLDGKVLTITGDVDDTFKITSGAHGVTTLATVDTAGNDAALIMDADGYIRLDSNGTYGSIYLHKGATNYGEFFTGGSDFRIRSNVDDQDMKFSGKDGGSFINALTLDMSEAGTATFNNDVIVNNTIKLPATTGPLIMTTGDLSGTDITVLRAGINADSGEYGFDIKYMGSRAANANSYSLFMHNLNGTHVEAMTVLQDGKVGIGNTAPTSTLHVTGDATVDDINLNGKVLTITGDTDDTFKITSGANGATTLATVDTAGADANLHLSVDGYAFIDAANVIILDATGAIQLKNNGTMYGQIYENANTMHLISTIADGNIQFQGYDGASLINALIIDMSEAGKAIFNAGATFADDVTVEDINLSGKVLTITGDTSDTFTITTGADGATTLATVDTAGNAANLILNADGRMDYISNDASGQHRFFGGAMGLAIMPTSGNGGADASLRNNTADADLLLRGNDGGSYITALKLDMSEAGKAIFNAGAEFKDNVGIGTATPTELLHIASTGDATIKLEADTDNAGGEDHNPKLELVQDGGGTTASIFLDQYNILNMYNVAAGDMRFGTSNTERMRIKFDGKTGIGTGTPLKTLHVNGPALSTVQTLTDASTVTSDFDVGQNFTLTLAGNRTLGAPSNVDAGQVGSIFIIQDGTGSRTLAYNSIWKFAGGTAPVLSTAAGAIDRLDYIVQSGTAIQAVLTKAYA